VEYGGICEKWWDLWKMVGFVKNCGKWEFFKREEAKLFGYCSGITGVLMGFVGLQPNNTRRKPEQQPKPNQQKTRKTSH
jgi:hypothetical protein